MHLLFPRPTLNLNSHCTRVKRMDLQEVMEQDGPTPVKERMPSVRVAYRKRTLSMLNRIEKSQGIGDKGR